MNHLEAWSSGEMIVHVDGAHQPVVVVVEGIKLAFLALVIGRAESSDPAFQGLLPATLIDVARVPRLAVSSREPLAEIVTNHANDFCAQLRKTALAHLAASSPAAPS